MICIFLDIDGVLNSLRTSVAFTATVSIDTPNYNTEVTKTTIDTVAVKLINKLIEETGAKIVVSSSHRYMFIKKYGYAEIPVLDLTGLRDYIHHLGIIGEVIDATEDLFTPSHKIIRGDEIKKWLKNHPDVENYVIFDDDSDMREEQLPHFVHTSTIDGFRFEHYCKARDILKLEKVSASVNSLSRTDQNYLTSVVYEYGDYVNFTHNGIRGSGLVKGVSILSEHLHMYIVKDCSGKFPNNDYPFDTFSIHHSGLSLVSIND